VFRLFNHLNIDYGKVNSSTMTTIRANIFKHYYYQHTIFQTYGTYVPSDHVIIRLLYSLASYLDFDLDIYRFVQDSLHHLCSAAQITSGSTYGASHQNTFFTTDCLMVSTTFEDQDIFSLGMVHWTKLRPIRCLSHTLTSMELYMPHTHRKDMVPGLTIVGVDIPLLAYQFKEWTKVNLALPAEDKESINIFVGRYILPNMIPEYVDIALRNRLEFIYRNEEVPITRKERSWASSYEVAVERPIHNVMHAIEATRMPYMKALMELPLIFTDTYLNAVPKNHVGLSPYQYWVNLFIYTDWFYPLITFITADQRNVSDVSKILRRVDRYINSSSTIDHIPPHLRYYFRSKYEKIKEHFG